MSRIGNFFFHHRNTIFPLAYILLFINGPVLLHDYRMAFVIGVIIAATGQFVRGITVGLDYIVRGGQNRQVYAKHLVQGGIFAHCRNPLYVGNYLILVGVGVASNSLLFLVVGLPFFLFVYRAIIAAEEAFLLGKFGEEFTAYCNRVNRVLPNFSGLNKTLKGMHFNWRRLISAEYGSAYIWMAAILIASLKNLWFRGRYDTHALPTQGLWSLAIVVSLAYVVARYFKKRGMLETA
jgi:protein-S-isoprenylcysteine O-methyltransferase Ste14